MTAKGLKKTAYILVDGCRETYLVKVEIPEKLAFALSNLLLALKALTPTAVLQKCVAAIMQN